MNNKLIANLFPTIHLLGEERNYILVIRKHTNQSMRNGHHMYFSSLSSAFAELFEFQVRANLSNGLNKSATEMIEIIESTRKEILDLLEPFEQLKPGVEGQLEPVQVGISGVSGKNQ